MSDDDWGDGPTSTPVATTLPSSFKDMNLDESGQGDSGFRGGGRGGRGGGRGGYSNRRNDENGDGSGDQRGGRRDYNNDGGGGGRGGRRDFNNDGDGGGRGGRRDFNNDGDGGGRGGRRDFNNDGDGGGRGGRRDFNNDGDGGGRGGRRDFNNDGDGGGRGGRRDFNNDGDGGGRRDNDGDRGGRRDFNKDGGERSGDGNAGEGEEKPRERYCPEDMETGEAIFDSRKQLYHGSGINFSKYEDISHSINGTDVPPEVSTFEEMGLRALLLGNLKKCNYIKPTPIQKFASPVLLAGRDVMACAQTGSGKTAGYLLPIINTLLSKSGELSGEVFPCKPECLILAPTRELALQIGKEANMYGSDSIIKSKVTYGGTSIGHQKAQIQRGCNILVATPGRLLQFVKENIVDLSNIQFFVLDEADRMLDMGFMTDVKAIVAAMPPKEKRVAAMFSATFPVPIQKAAADFLNDYIFVVIGVVGGACTDIHQEFFLTERSEKRSKLLEILKGTTDDDKVLVFCSSKKGADFTAASLSSQGISTTSIHGDRLQSQRELALREFTKGDRKVLVATSVAARGLDIPKVSIVVNYDLPTEIDEYVHRIGRTGRLGHIGRAISFYDDTNDSALMPHLVGILEGAGQPVPDFFSGGGVGPGGDGGIFASTDIRGGLGSGSAPSAVEVEEDWD